MDPITMAAMVSAGSNLIGGLFGQQNQANINAQNVQAQEAINQENIAMQKEFAQNGIQWKVADANAAGINPLAALGAQTASFSNVIAPQQQASNSLGKGLSSVGQDISRAIKDTMTAGDQHTLKMAQLQEQHGELENQMLASQIAKTNSANAGGPPTPAAGQSYFGGLDGQGSATNVASSTTAPIKVVPANVAPVSPATPGMEPGANPSIAYIRGPGDSYYPVTSEQFQHRTSNDSLANLIWEGGNRFGPMVGANFNPPPGVPLKPGNQWWYDPFSGYSQDKTWYNWTMDKLSWTPRSPWR